MQGTVDFLGYAESFHPREVHHVEIGKAQGQNWWCVMFPPLCFIDVSSGIVPDESKELLKENMNEEDFALISDNNSHSDISFKFKILEFFGSKKFTTAKN